MKNPLDDITYAVSRSMDIILVRYPTRTSLGAIMGSMFCGLVGLFHPWLSKISHIDIERVKEWHLISTGVLTCHIRTLISIWSKPTIVDESVDNIIALVERGDLSQHEQRQLYRELVKKVLENVNLKEGTRKNIDSVKRRIKKGKSQQRKKN